MAFVVNQIQGGRWDNLLRRVFPIKDRSVAPVMASELVPIVVAQEFEPEFYWPRDERMAFAFVRQAAVAAEISHVQLLNPAGSQSIIILDEVDLMSSVALLVNLVYLTGDLATVTTGPTGFRDQRFGAVLDTDLALGLVRRDTSVGGQGGLVAQEWRMGVANSPFTVKLNCVLPPGESVVFRTAVVNAVLEINMRWRERAAEPSELVG